MSKPLNPDFLDSLMRRYYPSNYKRILEENQDSQPHDKKGDNDHHVTGSRKRAKRAVKVK